MTPLDPERLGTILCPECNGSGRVKVPAGYETPPDYWTCSDCDGTGEIEVAEEE